VAGKLRRLWTVCLRRNDAYERLVWSSRVCYHWMVGKRLHLKRSSCSFVFIRVFSVVPIATFYTAISSVDERLTLGQQYSRDLRIPCPAPSEMQPPYISSLKVHI
jgi:hypothetical protein